MVFYQYVTVYRKRPIGTDGSKYLINPLSIRLFHYTTTSSIATEMQKSTQCTFKHLRCTIYWWPLALRVGDLVISDHIIYWTHSVHCCSMLRLSGFASLTYFEAARVRTMSGKVVFLPFKFNVKALTLAKWSVAECISIIKYNCTRHKLAKFNLDENLFKNVFAKNALVFPVKKLFAHYECYRFTKKLWSDLDNFNHDLPWFTSHKFSKVQWTHHT